MIHVIREEETLGPPYETCAFCGKDTPFWFEPKDVPVCKLCAIEADADEVPTKEAWAKFRNLRLVYG